jgi:hypothetical protein
VNSPRKECEISTNPNHDLIHCTKGFEHRGPCNEVPYTQHERQLREWSNRLQILQAIPEEKRTRFDSAELLAIEFILHGTEAVEENRRVKYINLAREIIQAAINRRKAKRLLAEADGCLRNLVGTWEDATAIFPSSLGTAILTLQANQETHSL